MLRHKSVEALPEKWDYVPLFVGAQIRVNRKMYYHHGIFIGDGVIHFGEGDPHADMLHSEGNKVNLCSLEDFLKGGLPEVRVYSRKEKKLLLPTDEIIIRAKAALGQGGYHFYRNNCEHFSNYCAFGVSYSKQADSFRDDIKNKIKKAES